MSARAAIRRVARRLLGIIPGAEVRFRRHIWSRISFPEPEMRVLADLPANSFDVAIDVGAALGGYTWILDRASRRVIAFEPGAVHADFIARGLSGTNIELVRAAVGREEATVRMYTPGCDTNALHSATLSSSNPVAHAASVVVNDVAQLSIDAFVRQWLVPGERLDFLKVDVEGYELAVFKGAAETLARDHPLVLCEIEARHNADYARVFGLFRDLGYSAFVLKQGRFVRFEGDALESVQHEEDLAYRLSPDYEPGSGRYINNFIFEHPLSRVKVAS